MAAGAWWAEALAVPDPEIPMVETSPAAHIAAIVIRRIRSGVSQPKLLLWSQVLNPVAAEAAAIAHPAHISRG